MQVFLFIYWVGFIICLWWCWDKLGNERRLAVGAKFSNGSIYNAWEGCGSIKVVEDMLELTIGDMW